MSSIRCALPALGATRLYALLSGVNNLFEGLSRGRTRSAMWGERFFPNRSMGRDQSTDRDFRQFEVENLRAAVSRPEGGDVFICADGSRLQVLQIRRRLAGREMLFVTLGPDGVITLESSPISQLRERAPLSVVRGRPHDLLGVVKAGALLVPGLNLQGTAAAHTVLQGLPGGDLLCLSPLNEHYAQLERLHESDLWRHAPCRIVSYEGKDHLSSEPPSLKPGSLLRHRNGEAAAVVMTSRHLEEVGHLTVELTAICRLPSGHVEVRTAPAERFLGSDGWYLDLSAAPENLMHGVKALAPQYPTEQERRLLECQRSLATFLEQTPLSRASLPVVLAVDLLCHEKGIPGPFSRHELEKLMAAAEGSMSPAIRFALYESIHHLLRHHNGSIEPAPARAQIVEEFQQRLLAVYEHDPHRVEMGHALQDSFGKGLRIKIPVDRDGFRDGGQAAAPISEQADR